jgi:hypothetical protein
MRTVIRTRAGAAALAGAAAITAAVAAVPTAASADEALNTCELDKKVAELTHWGSRADVNVVVWKAGHEASSHFEGIVEEGSTWKMPCGENWTDKEYKWVVFTGDGQFVRQGDGGYRNWAFYGVFDRPDDTTVNFSAHG